jgi:hypothetical protein
MTANIIEDLRSSFPSALVLFAYSKYTTQEYQNTHLILLNFLGQVAHHRDPSSPETHKLYDDYRFIEDSQLLPRQDRTKEALALELKTYERVFIVIDALDEFSLTDPSKARNLVQELEDLGGCILITSRNPVPFSEGGYISCEIRAFEEDVRLFLKDSAVDGLVGNVLRQREDLITAVVDKIADRAEGMFLPARLHLDSLVQCKNAFEVKKYLANLPNNLDSTYQSMMERIEERNDFSTLRFLSFLLVMEGRDITVDAMLQSVACTEDMEGDVRDHVLPIEMMLAACSGFVTVVDRYGCVDGSMKRLRHFKAFQFCRESFQ